MESGKWKEVSDESPKNKISINNCFKCQPSPSRETPKKSTKKYIFLSVCLNWQAIPKPPANTTGLLTSEWGVHDLIANSAQTVTFMASCCSKPIVPLFTCPAAG